jgi:hypothetical protein
MTKSQKIKSISMTILVNIGIGKENILFYMAEKQAGRL